MTPRSRTLCSVLVIAMASLALVATQPDAVILPPSFYLSAVLTGNIEVVEEREEIPIAMESSGCEGEPGFEVRRAWLGLRFEPAASWPRTDRLHDTGWPSGDRRAELYRVNLEIVHLDEVLHQHDFASQQLWPLELDLDPNCGQEGACDFTIALETHAAWTVHYTVRVETAYHRDSDDENTCHLDLELKVVE